MISLDWRGVDEHAYKRERPTSPGRSGTLGVVQAMPVLRFQSGRQSIEVAEERISQRRNIDVDAESRAKRPLPQVASAQDRRRRGGDRPRPRVEGTGRSAQGKRDGSRIVSRRKGRQLIVDVTDDPGAIPPRSNSEPHSPKCDVTARITGRRRSCGSPAFSGSPYHDR